MRFSCELLGFPVLAGGDANYFWLIRGLLPLILMSASYSRLKLEGDPLEISGVLSLCSSLLSDIWLCELWLCRVPWTSSFFSPAWGDCQALPGCLLPVPRLGNSL